MTLFFIDPITALTIFGAFFSVIAGVEKIDSVMHGAPLINTARYFPATQQQLDAHTQKVMAHNRQMMRQKQYKKLVTPTQ